jgi:hypothetical protein
VNLSLSTSAVDPQTRRLVPVPKILDESGLLSGQVEAISVAWNNQHINQGSPKPGGHRPGTTTAISGTYNADTGSYQMTWTSQIVGGSFNGFVGYWHLEGKFVGSGVRTNPGRTTVPAPASKSTTSTTRAATNSSPIVKLVNCAPVAGGWSSGGLVVNRANRTASYRVTVLFTTAAGKRLASASTVGSLAPGKFGFWQVSASFNAPTSVHCELGTS